MSCIQYLPTTTTKTKMKIVNHTNKYTFINKSIQDPLNIKAPVGSGSPNHRNITFSSGDQGLKVKFFHDNVSVHRKKMGL